MDGLIPVVIALIGLAITILGLVYKISAFSTRQELLVVQLKQEGAEIRHVLKRVPMIDFRLSYVERHLELSVPEMME